MNVAQYKMIEEQKQPKMLQKLSVRIERCWGLTLSEFPTLPKKEFPRNPKTTNISSGMA